MQWLPKRGLQGWQEASMFFLVVHVLSGSCSMEEYQCHNGDCIPQESACDFIIHCSDYSDEDERYCCGK